MNRRERRAGATKGGRDAGKTRGPAPADPNLEAAISHHQAGRLTKAKRLFSDILSREPKHAVALHLLGVIAYQQGDARQATSLIREAIALQPDDAEAHNNLGIALKGLGKPDDAITSFHAALAIQPNYARAHNNLGNALQDLGKLDDAIASYRKALTIQPDDATAHNNLGIALQDLGMPDDAIASYNKALTIWPDYAKAHNNLGKALYDLGKLDGAVASYHKAITYQPDYANAHNNLGIVLKDMGKLEEALAGYQRALTIQPDYAKAHNNLGNALKDMGKLEEALAVYQRALTIEPNFAEAHCNLVFGMNYGERYSQQDIFAESRRWEAAHATPGNAGEEGHARDRDPERRLRIGYVSPDFRRHSVSYFLEPLIAGHDRRRFEVFCYAQVASPDDVTRRFRGLADGWCSTVGMTDAAMAERIRADGIDILVDLAGHTANNRLLTFAGRPAPVQVSYLGYPNTTGMSAMDCRLTDDIADPEGPGDALHSEQLTRLPNGFLCYTPGVAAPAVVDPPTLADGRVTFGSFNNLSKVTPEVVETWARILERVPGSRLLIKSRPLADMATRKRYLEMYMALGIDAERVELRSWIASNTGHLGAYDRVDIGLDPFPYNGTTTTCEALWMGVPVVTFRGDRHASRVGASILTRVGLTELIAETADGYVTAAAALAKNPGRLMELRRNLRAAMAASPLCDAARFTGDVEAAYRGIWRRWCQGA